MSRVAYEAPLEKGDVEYGRVKVDELEDKHFEGQVILEFALGPMHFCEKQSEQVSGKFKSTLVMGDRYEAGRSLTA